MMRTQRTNKFIMAVMTVFAILIADKPLAGAFVSNPGIPLLSAVGQASYYSYECADLPMANGAPFDLEKRTCASWFYKFGTVLIVKALDTGRSTEVIVTDRGPNKRLVKQGRIIDLSKRAFQDICGLEKGLTRVAIFIKN